MHKIRNFHRALTEYINASLGQPFEWGKRDCVTYAIGAIEAMIGREGEKPAFNYRTLEEAIEYAKQWSLEEGMMTQLDAYEVSKKFHQPGDILLMQHRGLERVYVVFDRRAYSPLLNAKVSAFDIHVLFEKRPGLKLLRFD